MTTIVEKIETLPQPEEFLRRLENIKTSAAVVHSEDYSADVIAYGSDKIAHWTKWEDGSGGEYTVVNTKEGVFVWGYDHESEHNAYANDVAAKDQEALQNVPEQFSWIITQSEFNWGGPDDAPHIYATLAFWSTDNETWQYSPQLTQYDEYDDGGFSFFFKHVINYDSSEYIKYLNHMYQELNEDEIVRVEEIFVR